MIKAIQYGFVLPIVIPLLLFFYPAAVMETEDYSNIIRGAGSDFVYWFSYAQYPLNGRCGGWKSVVSHCRLFWACQDAGEHFKMRHLGGIKRKKARTNTPRHD
jgi:hypothetical protein